MGPIPQGSTPSGSNRGNTSCSNPVLNHAHMMATSTEDIQKIHAERHLREQISQDLLAVLAGFIQDIVQHRVSCLEKDDRASADISHGQKLVGILEKFVRVNLSANRSLEPEEGPKFVPTTSSADEDEPKDTNYDVVVSPAISLAHVKMYPELTYSDHIPSWAREHIRRHVFNKMPIRLLTFDSTGSNPKLIERNDIFRQLQATFHEERVQYTRGSDPVVKFLNQRSGYAILSHTWIRDIPGDVVFKDWGTRKLNSRGYDKIVKFCHVAARNHEVTLAWMDTICINKESSSELDESIRSMYKWYRGAHVCIVYLSETRFLNTMHQDSWFTRGWTLQELLAPRDVHFYNSNWTSIFHDETGLELPFPPHPDVEIRWQIHEATSITEHELNICQQGNIERIPISRRMQLASRRSVTREEDTAYSLMGILGVDISIAYGEGSERSFFRLVREVISSHMNILEIFNCGFTRTGKLMPYDVRQYQSRSPSFDSIDSIDFLDGKTSLLDQWRPLEPIIFTHLGIRIPLLLVPALRRKQGNLNSHLGFPQGEYFGTVLIYDWHSECESYGLLDSRIYRDELVVNRSENKSGRHALPFVSTFGVLNFGLQNKIVMLPEQCLSVPLNCGTLQAGRVRATSSSIKIMPARDPVVFQLMSTTGRNERIYKDELGKHGMQLVTLYL